MSKEALLLARLLAVGRRMRPPDAPESDGRALLQMKKRLAREPDPVQGLIDFVLFRRKGKALTNINRAIERAVASSPKRIESVAPIILEHWRPWRGASGRLAARQARAQKSAGRAALILEQHAAGRSNRAIAAALDISQKTVERALRGKRQRRRSCDVRRGEGGRFGRGAP